MEDFDFTPRTQEATPRRPVDANSPAFPASSLYFGLTKLEYFTAEAMKGLLAQGHAYNDPLLGQIAVANAVNVLGELENCRSWA